MNALSTLKRPSSGNQSINDNGVYRLLLRPQKCRVSVKRQMVNGKHAHAPEVCNIVWLLAEWKGGGEEGRTEILLIKFAKLFAIKPLSCWTNNVQHATASSNNSNGATNTTICSRTTVRIAISVWFPSLSISPCGVCCPCLSIYCVAVAAAPAWGKCFCIAAVARLHHTRVSQCVCLSVCVEVILKIASQESSPLLLPSAPSSLYQLLLLLLLFDLRGKSYVQCPLLTIAGAASACPRLDICTHKYT